MTAHNRPFRYTYRSVFSFLYSLWNRIVIRITLLGCRLFSLTNNETVSLLFDEKKLDELERQIILMSLMDKMGQLYGLHATVDSNHNKAFLGLSAILQHYVDSDEAKLFWDFYCNACTVKDVWNFFLTENELRPESVKFKNRLR